MAGDPATETLPSIVALPPTTVRQLGSSQVLIDPSSVVKELIDNALDARANAIFVDIAMNTIDSIQVKDTGHGIPQEDRPLVCRRYCTSKIRDFQDLKEVGGKWLGFRGEAMASMAEMSGALEISTRVEGEPVAVKLKYGRSGELVSSEHASAPVGTIVKVTELFKSFPVRKQAALKHSTKSLAKIRRLMQAYALARPTVRFCLRVLKAKSNKGDFVYAPKKDANVEDAAFKVIGKDCALQCDWTAMEIDGFEVHAFLPKPDAMGSKIAGQGAFISVDARPVSTSRGILKQLVTVFRDRLRKANPSLGSVRDPFCCINIICPPDSYDPNIEPAKDDVLFEDGELVITAVDKLLISYYAELVVDNAKADETNEPPTSAQQLSGHMWSCERSTTPFSIHQDENDEDEKQDVSEAPQSAQGSTMISSESKKQPQWRSNMYGIDEEDLELLSDNQPPVIEEEEGRRAADVSNPWTIARMNISMKAKKPFNNPHLLTPAKGSGDAAIDSSSPAPATHPRQQFPVEPLTPQTSSQQNVMQSSLDEELEKSIQRLSRSSNGSNEVMLTNLDTARGHQPPGMSAPDENVSGFASSSTSDSVRHSQAIIPRTSTPASKIDKPPRHFGSFETQTSAQCIPLDMIPSSSPTPRRGQRKQQPRNNTKQSPHPVRPNDEWFGEPMHGHASKPTRQRKPRRTQAPAVPMFPGNNLVSRRLALNADDGFIENDSYSENNTEIRDSFGRSRAQQPRSASAEVISGPSTFTSVNAPSRQIRGNYTLVSDDGERNHARPSQGSSQRALLNESSPRATSAEPLPRPRHVNNQRLLHSNHGANLGPPAITEQLRAYEDREDPHRDVPVSPTQPARAPRNIPSHELAPKTRTVRRRTTDGPHRTRSSKLPLERVPREYRIQDVVLHVNVNMKQIMQSLRGLDMNRNSLEWGYPACEDACNTFSTPMTDSTLNSLPLRLAQLVDEVLEREDGVDVVPIHVIEEGVRRAVHGRRAEVGEEVMEEDSDLSNVREVDVQVDGLKHVEEWTQQVEAAENDDAKAPETSINKVGNDFTAEVTDEFGEGIDDDEILMDF